MGYYNLGSEDAARAANEEISALRQFVLLYRQTYMETDTHPNHLDEGMVMMSARELCERFGIKQEGERK